MPRREADLKIETVDLAAWHCWREGDRYETELIRHDGYRMVVLPTRPVPADGQWQADAKRNISHYQNSVIVSMVLGEEPDALIRRMFEEEPDGA